MGVGNEQFLELEKRRDYFTKLLLGIHGGNGWMLETGKNTVF